MINYFRRRYKHFDGDNNVKVDSSNCTKKTFQSFFKKSNRKPNKIWVDKGGEFYNRSTKPWLEKNDIEMYSTHNEERFVVAERFIWTIKNKIYKHMTSISKNVYINKLDDKVNEYNNTKRRTTKMKPVDVKNNTYTDLGKEVNDKKNCKK